MIYFAWWNASETPSPNPMIRQSSDEIHALLVWSFVEIQALLAQCGRNPSASRTFFRSATLWRISPRRKSPVICTSTLLPRARISSSTTVFTVVPTPLPTLNTSPSSDSFCRCFNGYPTLHCMPITVMPFYTPRFQASRLHFSDAPKGSKVWASYFLP